KILEELGTVSAELAQIREAVSRHNDRVSRLDVIAPTAGIIQGIKVNTIGGVIAPGEVLMEILPVENTLVAEVRISPRDIGHVTIGQAATLKITAYDSARFGSISGSISQISPSTLVSNEGQPYYRATIALDSNAVGDDPTNRILPGMIVSAEISTGSKTILQYLASPVFRALRGSFRER
ncbi:MAG: HlyD family efflux transporter periplasmic adaptor subunit, partial [Alphaproteobacteria bacterium]